MMKSYANRNVLTHYQIVMLISYLTGSTGTIILYNIAIYGSILMVFLVNSINLKKDVLI